MQHAPSVAYPVGRFVGERRALALAAAVAALVWVLWWAERWWRTHAVVTGLWAVPWLWLGLGLLWAWRAWRAEAGGASGELVWVNEEPHQGWYLECGDQRMAVTPWVAVDAGQRIWLRLTPVSGRGCWVWASRHGDPDQWLALRRALWSARHSDSTPRV